MSNLLEKASILTTPTAYDDGKILSVKPSIVLGAELVTNGDFSDGTNGWGASGEATISVVNGELEVNVTGGGGGFVRTSNIPCIDGRTYIVSIDYRTGTYVGDVLPIIDNNSLGLITPTSETQTKTWKVVAIGSSFQLAFVRSAAYTGTIYYDNVSVKEAIDGDFDFTRNSSATRVNAQGLVEDVQILSSNLVQNGDFSQEGSELVTNGGFDTDTDWSKGASWSIADGKASSNGLSNNSLSQTTPILEVGKTYKLKIDITHISGTLLLLGAYYETQISFTESGSYDIFIVPKVTTFSVYASSFIGSIDNVSVKEVGQNWLFQNGWNMGDGVAVYSGTVSAYRTIYQENVLTVNSKYRLTFDIVSIASGSIENISQSSPTSYNTVGTKTEDFIATNTDLFLKPTTDADLTITNISVIEITDDTNLPRIDYTDGVGSWLFEPQSTNLVTYSEDFSQWTKAGGVSIESGYLAPNGSNNAYKVSGTSSSSLYLASITNSTDTRTIWAKTVSGTGDVYLCGNLNDANALFTVTSQWQRFELNGFTGGGATTFYAVDFRGSSTLTEVIIWGAQVEALSYATSYIPTNGSTVTRLADAALGAGSSDLINSTEGVLYAEIAALNSVASLSSYITISDGTYNNRASILFSSGGTNQIRTFLRVGGATQIDVTNSVTDVTSFNKVAFSYKENDFKVYINGTLVSTDTSGSVWSADTVTKLSFSEINTLAGLFQGKTKCLAVFKEALTDAELTCLTTI